MAIHKVKISNFKCFKGLFELELNKGLNILVGNNETGKSTILEAISYCFNWYLWWPKYKKRTVAVPF